MAIKRKDGSIYKLRGPNPVMFNQSFWDGEKMVIHNINPPEIVTKEGYLDDVEVEEVLVSEPEPPKKKREKEPPKDLVYVLPAVVKESYDPLYNETRSQMTFGPKFTMEVVVIQRGDLQAELWTNSTTVGVGSIVYVPNEKRWWKVGDVYRKGDGHVIVCVPSGLQPSFEE